MIYSYTFFLVMRPFEIYSLRQGDLKEKTVWVGLALNLSMRSSPRLTNRPQTLDSEPSLGNSLQVEFNSTGLLSLSRYRKRISDLQLCNEMYQTLVA